jgi:N-acetylmuramoyl-L-alanine amidase
VQQSRNYRNRLALCVSSLLCPALLGLSVQPISAQDAGAAGRSDGPQPMTRVHLWVAGRTLALRVSPVTDTRETYVPLTALASTGAEFRLISNGNAVHVTARSNRELDIPLTPVNGVAMVALSELAKVLDAAIETSTTEPNAKPTFRSPDTVYLLAHVTDARFENGTLRVRTSFPVPFHARMLAETRPVRGYVDCVGAELPDNFRPAPLRDGEKQVLRLRAGQNSPAVARIVIELADGAALRAVDTYPGPLELVVSTYMRPGARPLDSAPAGSNAVAARQSAAPNSGDQGDHAPAAVGAQQGSSGTSGVSGSSATDTSPGPPTHPADPKVAQGSTSQRPILLPVEVRGLDVVTDDPAALRFDVVTGGRVRPIVRYTPGTTQMLVDIPNATLVLPDGEEQERTLKHPLISGVRMETIQGSTAPMTRLTFDTARILGYSLNVQQGSFSLELRVPRNATGVLADKVIVVDAGHGGSATGATGGGVCEKDCTLAIALKLRAELEACGAHVVMTRTRDSDVSLSDRSRMGNEIGADLFVSIHNDSNERSNSASGTSTYFHASDPSSRALATCVQHAVMATTGLPSRGVLSDTVMYNSGFAVLRGSSMPAVLCEVAYINNQVDRTKLIDSQFQQRVAKAICDGLRTYVEGSPRRNSHSFVRPMPDHSPAEGTGTESGSSGS